MKLVYSNLQKKSYATCCPVVDTAQTLCIGSSGLYERQECYEDIDMHSYLKKRYWGRHFRTKGYCVSTVAFDQEQIESYVRHQLQTDKKIEQGKLWNK